jgi:hypothetical protein
MKENNIYNRRIFKKVLSGSRRKERIIEVFGPPVKMKIQIPVYLEPKENLPQFKIKR